MKAWLRQLSKEVFPYRKYILAVTLSLALFGSIGVRVYDTINQDVVLGVRKDVSSSTREPFTFSDDEVVEQPINSTFSVFAPQIGVNAPVFENIDGSNESEYLPNVLKGVAHYKHKNLGDVVVDGALPGQQGNVFLFGHSQIPGGSLENYQGVFNNLEEFVHGDIVKVFYDNQEFKYKVTEGHVIEKDEVQYLEKTETETLTLMSCWPLGLDWKRFVVRAERVE